MVRSKHLHVQCTCTLHPSPLLHTAPSRPCQGVPMNRVWCPKVKVSFNRRTPRQKVPLRFSAPGSCNLHPTEVAPPIDFKLVGFACDLQVWDRWRHQYAPQGREKMVRSKHLHMHCTCTMHPSALFYTAPSRPYQGAPMYRVWCR